jgi:hypothetical protein
MVSLYLDCEPGKTREPGGQNAQPDDFHASLRFERGRFGVSKKSMALA